MGDTLRCIDTAISDFNNGVKVISILDTIVNYEYEEISEPE